MATRTPVGHVAVVADQRRVHQHRHAVAGGGHELERDPADLPRGEQQRRDVGLDVDLATDAQQGGEPTLADETLGGQAAHRRRTFG